MQILVVDDEPMIRSALRVGLEAVSHDVSEAGSAASMFDRLEREPSIDLITLDLTLGDQDGFELARAARARRNVPIIMITARSEPMDRVRGLEHGADDYIVKPYHIREVLLRIRSVMQRYGKDGAAKQDQEGSATGNGRRYEFEAGVLDARQRSLVASSGQVIDLTDAEFDILAMFVQHPGRVMTRDDMTLLLKGRPWSPEDRTIDGHVARLRKKIEPSMAVPRFIKTVWGVGYVFAGLVRQAT